MPVSCAPNLLDTLVGLGTRLLLVYTCCWSWTCSHTAITCREQTWSLLTHMTTTGTIYPAWLSTTDLGSPAVTTPLTAGTVKQVSNAVWWGKVSNRKGSPPPPSQCPCFVCATVHSQNHMNWAYTLFIVDNILYRCVFCINFVGAFQHKLLIICIFIIIALNFIRTLLTVHVHAWLIIHYMCAYMYNLWG